MGKVNLRYFKSNRTLMDHKYSEFTFGKQQLSLEIKCAFSYNSLMRLNITDVRSEDFGEYECVSKNDINTTAATFFIYGNISKMQHLYQNRIES